ncbi:lytic murein transglycosylase, partial [Octadecabacter sp.]|nr:lytic murein transglycosylase [Octadecabacter sp.]
MRVFFVIYFAITLLGSPVTAQNPAGFITWAENSLWPRARAAGVTPQTFQSVLHGITLDPTLPSLTPPSGNAGESQAEFRHPRAYFSPGGLRSNTRIGQSLAQTHASTLRAVENAT